ncbi:hypothetical protein [Clavibacter capsici]|uniref:Uncharacterized protein n=1 Tax=Clavibacter capsici TaxID=1874630 RepID=A0A0M5JQ65_9MICO|nr:hypothetical protein [Clavibacter capsici]ALD13252.1 hypothetical protein AES38_10255 [Clavibacter capsici]QIS39595.1 hypothetical protein GW572_10640 [Clavibacter capsici]QIS42484.1 hypothetical protein GW571_10240 [Clavibacter capsici]QIS45434.1 hypothetical protein GW570_10225 [Clavibacter capsici]
MPSRISSAARRLAAALALAAVVTLGVSVAAPTDAASAASGSTRTYSVEHQTAATGAVTASDRQRTGRLYIAPRYIDRGYAGGTLGAAIDVCNSYDLGNQCLKYVLPLLRGNLAKDDDCQTYGMDAVIPSIQLSRCRKG